MHYALIEEDFVKQHSVQTCWTSGQTYHESWRQANVIVFDCLMVNCCWYDLKYLRVYFTNESSCHVIKIVKVTILRWVKSHLTSNFYILNVKWNTKNQNKTNILHSTNQMFIQIFSSCLLPHIWCDKCNWQLHKNMIEKHFGQTLNRIYQQNKLLHFAVQHS